MLALVPIPPTHIEQTWAILNPYVLKIAERGKLDPLVISGMLHTGEVQAFLIWDDEKQVPVAFVGVQYERRGKDLIGSMKWLMGENRAAWVHLLTDLETYLREHQKCVAVKAIARRGWSKHLKASGYRETHVVFEKEF